jgi:hypothetical protein
MYALFTVILAGAELNWASAVGYNFVPFLISYFIIKNAKSSKRFIVASIVTVVLFFAMNATLVKDMYDLNYDTVYTGCFERNLAVAQMANEVEKKQFCSCFTDQITAFAMRQDAMVFYGLTRMDDVNQSTAKNAFLSEAFMQCNAAR